MQFTTPRTAFAAFLHAGEFLTFQSCSLAPDNRSVVFQFDDPQRKGASLELEFENDLPLSARKLFNSYRYLRTLVDAAKGAGNGK